MKAYIIDPWAKTVTLANHARWDGAAMRGVITAYGALHGQPTPESLDSVRLHNGDRIWVDDEGWKKPDLRVFHLKGYDWPVAGIGIVVGLDGPDQADVKFELEDIQDMVLWTGLDTTGEVDPPTTKEGIFKGMAASITTMGAPRLKPGERG